MRAEGALLAALVLVSTSVTLQVLSAEDLYWEGEEDASNEFLEVKEEDLGIAGHLRRLKRGFFDFNLFGDSSSSTTTESSRPEEPEKPDEFQKFGDNEVDADLGSGSPDRDTENEPREKTLRVTFVVNQPYQAEYNKRDSQQFKSFSTSLADSVNQLFDQLPGTQRASLVRIQSRISDEFTCKVTLDIVTTGYEETDQIASILHDHIRNRRYLGTVAVSDADFSSTVIDPGSALDVCAADELTCNDGRCVAYSAKCNGYPECSDGSDEEGCQPATVHWGLEPDSVTEYDPQGNPEPPVSARWDTNGSDWNGDNRNDYNPSGYPETTPYTYNVPEPCRNDELRCDQTRCVPLSRRCDGTADCDDRTDEYNCEEICGADDFKCPSNGRCIARSRQCDKLDDCPQGEDEKGCPCTEDEFTCISDRSCIERRKVCDNKSHCADNSDEANCACSSEQWQCDHGSCIKRSQRCDGRVDCPTDRSDERYCFDSGSQYFTCRTNQKRIPLSLRCNRQYDCSPGDFSDEQNCPCGIADFKCDNGFCVPADKHCDRTHDCQDGSDERDCTYGTVCMAYEYKCSSGKCVVAEAACNGTVECDDGSDEKNCPCKRDVFHCRDGTCINIALRCNGISECRNGEDEINCPNPIEWCPRGRWSCGDGSCIPEQMRCDGYIQCEDSSDEKNCFLPAPLNRGPPSCPADSFACGPLSSVKCAHRCDGYQECDSGEDEENCNECNHECDNRCLNDQQICDGYPDCSDGSDERHCGDCDGPNDFRCKKSGECLIRSQHCNGVIECIDGSDEEECSDTVTASPDGCKENQYQCRDGSFCINYEFYCDGHKDCVDNSDEEDCNHCGEGEFRCTSGQCILASEYCDGTPQCYDQSDEQGCPTTRSWFTTTPAPRPQYPPYRPPYQEPTSPPYQRPTYPPYQRPTQSPYQRPTPPPYQPPYTQEPIQTTAAPYYPVRPYPNPVEPSVPCNRAQWRCENGPCIDSWRRCDGHVDCPLDGSDEFDCPPGTPIALKLRTYPDEQTVRRGGDAVFQCRDEGPQRSPVRWVREGGRPLKPGSTDRNGRLEMFALSPGDSGTYICQATQFLGHPDSEIRVQLTVDSKSLIQPPMYPVCQTYEATCGNGDCIPKSAICDGRQDCRDGSDEDSCMPMGLCEPNQFQCRSGKCVLKTWRCDSEDDCGDQSDEENCGPTDARPGECLPVEFRCQSQGQCIPKSYHCDEQNDCFDGSDEIGCAKMYIIQPPSPSNVLLNVGDTLTLTCKAIGTPTPLISWRLNWGHVPQNCTSTSQNGVGTLTCHNMQPEHSGAYSCEAINNRVTSIAKDDSIVYVNRTSVCPSGYFNSEARSQSECIRCFCFGESTQCQSADLFTYNMPTPLGEGGTRLVGVKQDYNGEIQIDPQSINDNYYYEPLRNGATVSKQYGYRSYGSGSRPYLTLPETYNGNQLTSYGGYIRYQLAPHSTVYGQEDNIPDIIIKGKFETLVHQHRGEKSNGVYIQARLTPENWQKTSQIGLRPATREDIMMALDNIEMILLRADLNNAGVNITDFVMESAQTFSVGLGPANLVEECICPPGYAGLSCQNCASGYVREKSGPWLGNCRREQPTCPRGTYGDPASGYACRPCPCPLTNKENNFASSCALGPAGNVICDCAPGYAGQSCDYCAPGFEGNPLMLGDSCKPKKTDYCDPVGTLSKLPMDECQCKDNVQGRYCDQCKDNSFYLSPDFTLGCAQCFCSGVTQRCTSSNLRRKTTATRFNTPQLIRSVRVYKSAPTGLGVGQVKYNAPNETNLTPTIVRGKMTLENIDRARPAVYYWSLPDSFSGDKVTAYGGYLTYTLTNVPYPSVITAADVQLVSENRLTFHYFGNFAVSNDGTLNASVQFLEKGWQRPDGKEVSRENFLMALADVKAILIKATYSDYSAVASLESASIETAEAGGFGPQAVHVEQCICPAGYVGTSCEDCAPGFTRNLRGLYLKNCEPCECNGHSSTCHPETGVCFGCRDNTDGDSCDTCKPGYQMENDVCVQSNPVGEPQIDCSSCDSRGLAYPCQDGRCQCKQNVEGEHCDRCRPGTFALDGNNPLGCLPCYCSGVTSDCYEARHYSRMEIPAPMIGPNYGGYSITNLDGNDVYNEEYIPSPTESELMYSFSFPPMEQLYWSIPAFPGNQVLSYGGVMTLTQSFASRNYNAESTSQVDVVLDGNDKSIYWRNPTPMRSGEKMTYKVPLSEDGWYVLNTEVPASRNDFMSVLSQLKRVLVRATLTDDLISTSISDVSMDTAVEMPGINAARQIEVCKCPEGYIGTSCENCAPRYYRNSYGDCQQCPCNGHECHMNANNEVKCVCSPPYSGPDCSAGGVVMELLPTIHETGDPTDPFRKVTLVCKYRAPERLTIRFYFEGREVHVPKYYYEASRHRDGYHGEHVWNTVWDTRHRGEKYSCHTFTANEESRGILTTSLPQTDSYMTTTVIPPPQPPPTITVSITSPTIKIEEVGSSVNFTCQARSQLTSRPLPIEWSKADGELPQGRYFVDTYTGLLLITNLQISDSGKYICESNDGVSSASVPVTLKVPGNEMTLPNVITRPSTGSYYEGDYVEIQCVATGNPTPRVSWQREGNMPLARSSHIMDSRLVIERVSLSDSGEYRCTATNSAGSQSRTVLINVRPKTTAPRDKLTVSDSAPNVNEGQTIQIVCTGTVNIPRGTIDWVREDRMEFTANVRSENGVLYVEYARPENQGVYTCQATSPDIEPVSVLLSVVPIGLPPVTSNITVSQELIKIPTGGNGMVDCNPTGYPQPLIRWKKYNEVFGTGVSQRGNNLIISNAQESDAGYYVCEGTVNGESINSIYVYVEIIKREEPRLEIWPQGEQSVTLDTSFDLQCRVLGGVPDPVITWSRSGGRPLSPHTQILKNNVLRFEKVEVNDEGEYECVARNEAGTSSASAVIKVRSPPVVIITPSDYLQVIRGDPLTVECRAKGYPEPLVSISSMNPDRREVVAAQPGMAVLYIGSVSERDEGNYVCTASSPAGTIDEQFMVRVNRGDGGDIDPGSGEPPEYNPDDSQPKAQVAIEGKDATIQCDAPEGYTVRWSRTDNRPLQWNAEQRGAALIIHQATTEDSGQYECLVVDKYNTPQHSALTEVRVVRPLRISLEPKTQTVQPGSSPVVSCIVEGDSTIDITWRNKDGQPFPSRIESRGNQLLFNHIEIEDAGKYECVARTPNAKVSADAEVIVSEENRVPSESHAQDQYARVGDTVHLSCNVMQPFVKIHWTKNGAPLPRSKLDADGSLLIKNANPSDTGRYICYIQDRLGRQESNHVNLYIKALEGCSDTQVLCDIDKCIDEAYVCDGIQDCYDETDEENCEKRRKRKFYGSPPEDPKLVSIDQPRRKYRENERVEVLCRASWRGINVDWERYSYDQQRQYVEVRKYGDGAMLVIADVKMADAGVYRCTGRDSYGRTSSDDFNLEVIPASYGQPEVLNNQHVYTARLNDSLDLPCNHDLEEPATIEWSREYTLLPSDVRKDEQVLHLERVTEADAGVYVCRVSNPRGSVEARAILKVERVVPMFDGNAHVALPTIKDAYRQFHIEISFKPIEPNGLILHNSNNPQDSASDFVALQLIEGVPEFSLHTSSGLVTVRGDVPLELNTWHTIRVNRINNKVTMDVDNSGPYVDQSMDQWAVLDLKQPLYIGGGSPAYVERPEYLSQAQGFVGCVSMLILGREEQNILVDSIEQFNINTCDTCSPNLCLNNGVCQEARNERGYMCLCAVGFAGVNCDRTGAACRPGLCGPGKCNDTATGYKCSCPVTYTGPNCNERQQIEYPAFTGSAYLAIRAPQTNRVFAMSLKIKASPPVTDGIIMYCAESARGHGAFMALSVHNGRLEFRYDLGDGTAPVVLTANRSLPADEWTAVHIARIGNTVTLKTNMVQLYQQELEFPLKEMHLDTPMFVGGVDDSIVLNPNTGVTGGFYGCIKEVNVEGQKVDIVNSSIQSANVQECSMQKGDRGDIPEIESVCSQCRNGGACVDDSQTCSCPPGYTGTYCESAIPAHPRYPPANRADPCAARPCRSSGQCRRDSSSQMGYACDCPLGYAGANCQMPLQLYDRVGFNGNGHLELPANLLRYDRLDTEPVLIAIAFHTNTDGVLFFQQEHISNPNYGNYMLLRVERGYIVLDWHFGSGVSTLTIDDVYVSDGERHNVIVQLNTDYSIWLKVDGLSSRTSQTNGLENLINAESNIYIGGIPKSAYGHDHPGLTGCIDQVELMSSGKLNLGEVAVAGWNAQRCREY